VNILIYIPDMSQSYGGIRQYSVGLLNILSEDSNNTYFIYHNNNDSEVLKFKRVSNFTFIDDHSVSLTFFEKKLELGKRLYNFLVRRLRLGNQLSFSSIIDKLCIKFKVDIIHCPYQYIPVTRNAKLITTLHDVQELHFPEYFSPEERAYRATSYLDFLKRADKVVVSYKHIKCDLVTYFQVPENKVNVILLDMQKLWFDKYSEKEMAELGTYSLPAKYLLYPANTWKHKNHLLLIEAVKYLKETYNKKVYVVCTGHQNEHYIVIKNKIEDLGLRDQVLFLGIVNELSLYTLYKRAIGVVIPTQYEAGSFPLMESMLLGVPVVCSNVTSLPETIGDEAFLFDPFSVKSIGEKMLELWEFETFRKKSIENSLIQSLAICNINSLSKFQHLYSSLK
jgi:glycosyltransferase involved in cell wall biosynthesis